MLKNLVLAAFTMATVFATMSPASASGRGLITDRCTDSRFCYRLSCNGDRRDCEILFRSTTRYKEALNNATD